MSDTLPILIVEDDPGLREAIRDTLELSGHAVIAVGGGVEALAVIAETAVCVVVSDVRMDPMDGITLLREIRSAQPQLPVVLMTAYADVDRAVEAMRAGACDFLLKPFEPSALLAHVARYRLPASSEDDGVVAEDVVSRNLFALAARVAQADATVLLTGESGVGKEVVARYIHRHSARQAGPFVAINCAAIPDSLLEATLFGYEKGAFTGATSAQAGKFEQAQGGTLLLDEVTEMQAGLQAKLLRVLQEREVERVGGKKPVALDIRIVATSNRDMAEAVRKGLFREDLYYRLNVFPLLIPSLRQRPADICPLARHLLAGQARRSGRPGLRLGKSAELALLAHPWPGNIRELDNAMQRAAILCAGEEVGAEHLHLTPGTERVWAAEFAAEPAPLSAARRADAALPDSAGEALPPANMKNLEREHILATLKAVNGSRKQAVERLGISERTLRYKLKQYREEGFYDEAP